MHYLSRIVSLVLALSIFTFSPNIPGGSVSSALGASNRFGQTSEEPVETEDTMPVYFQTDYPDTLYGNGTIATDGCGITSLAMVASYMTGHQYFPDELARYFGGSAENNIKRLENGSDALQLSYKKAENWHETYQALKDGKVAIALMTGDSLFTEIQHFIVLAGINENGKIIVHDPNWDNYELWNLKRAFEEGFSEGDILCGFGGAWIYDKSAMPEDPFIYFEPSPIRADSRYPQIHLTAEEQMLLARVVWVEARGESFEGQQAVAEIVFNRLCSDAFPDNLHDVIYGEGQFRSVPYLEDAEPYQTQYDAIEKALYGPYVLPEDVFYFATTPTNDNVWGTIGGHVFCYAAEEE